MKMKAFAELSQTEQQSLRDAHEAGHTLELWNANIGGWFPTYRPSFSPETIYRVAEVDSKPMDIKRG